jgi:two-component system alkaline phosphatase synthesis response regulator PhoP
LPKKILAVDDEQNIVKFIQINLEHEGYEVVTAFDGKEALEKVQKECPDLVVLDVMMPYMDGFEVLQTLRKNSLTRELPVIMLTAKTTDNDVVKGYQSGADVYLEKPFKPAELLTFIKRIFDMQEQDNEAETSEKVFDINDTINLGDS